MRVIAPFSNDKISDDAAARSAIFSLLRRRAMAPPNILPFVVAGRAVEPATESPTDDLGPQFNFTVWFLMSLAGGFLAMRLYCQISRHRDLWWDDYVLVAATVIASPPPLPPTHHSFLLLLFLCLLMPRFFSAPAAIPRLTTSGCLHSYPS